MKTKHLVLTALFLLPRLALGCAAEKQASADAGGFTPPSVPQAASLQVKNPERGPAKPTLSDSRAFFGGTNASEGEPRRDWSSAIE